MLRLTSEEIELFKSEPVSGKVYKQLKETFEKLMREIALGVCLDGSSMEVTALNYAKLCGNIEVLNEILDMQPINPETETE